MKAFYISLSFIIIFCSCQIESPPNIILIMADDQGWGDVGYNGHPYLKTPNLDSMAKNGAIFTRFYSAGSVCSPTRASVMTGRHPERMGICSANCGHIQNEEITLAELVKKKGYRTGHFGKWHLGTLTKDILDANRGGRKQNEIHYAPPKNHGFDVSFVTESKVPTWDPMITPPKSSGDVNESLIEGEAFGTYYWSNPGVRETENLEGDDSRVIMDRVIPFIEEAVSERRPFLSIVWFHAPHLPVLTSNKYKSLYSGLSEDQQEYYGVITAMDEQVGRLRSKLKNLNIADNTLVFYTSDNGPETLKEVREKEIPYGRAQGLTNGLRGRKRSLHDGGIRVPGIVEWPNEIKPGTVVDLPCFTSDYFPTIAKILDINLKQYNRPYDGEDLQPYWSKQKYKRDNPLAFYFKKKYALIDNEFKLYANENEKPRLFNLIKDPSEQLDFASQYPNKFKSLIDTYQKWYNSVQKSNAGLDY